MSLLKHLLRNILYQRGCHSRDSAYFRESGIFRCSQIFSRNKSLIIILLAATGAFLLLCLGAFIAAFPLLLTLLKWVYQNGIGGILELLLTVLERFWKGAGEALL